jgi:hypothetical protein
MFECQKTMSKDARTPLEVVHFDTQRGLEERELKGAAPELRRLDAHTQRMWVTRFRRHKGLRYLARPQRFGFLGNPNRQHGGVKHGENHGYCQ